jgi:hypothetical protein
MVGTGSATGTILDDERANFGLAIVGAGGRSFFSEDEGSATFTVELSSPAEEPISVRLEAMDGSATLGSDYGAPDKEDFVIAAGDTSATVSVPLLDEGAVEVDESFTLVASIEPRIAGSLSSILASSIAQAARQVTITDSSTIGDNKAPRPTTSCTGANAIIHTTPNRSPPLCLDLTDCFMDEDDAISSLSYVISSSSGGAFVTMKQKASISFKSICFNPTAQTSYQVGVSANDGKSTSVAINFQVQVGPEAIKFQDWNQYEFKAAPTKTGMIVVDLPVKDKDAGTFWGIDDAGCTVSNMPTDGTCVVDADQHIAMFSYGGQFTEFNGSVEVCVGNDDYCFRVKFPASPSIPEMNKFLLLKGEILKLPLGVVSGTGVYDIEVSSSNNDLAAISYNRRDQTINIVTSSDDTKGSGFFTIKAMDRPASDDFPTGCQPGECYVGTRDVDFKKL